MKKKRIVGTLLAASMALTATFTGCSLVSSNSKADFSQVIAEVNISSAEGLSAKDSKLMENYKKAVGTTNIYKRDLIAYYLNYGYMLVNNYGYSPELAFTTLINNLVDEAVITQYSIMYLLEAKAGGADASAAQVEAVVNKYLSCDSYTASLEYLLTDEDAEDPQKDIKIAKYSLYSSINSAIDSAEEKILEGDDETSGTLSRTTPTGVDTEQEDFYPKAPVGVEGYEEGDLYYNVYTGYANYQLAESGIYQEDKLDKTNKSTRTEAYNDFLSTLISSGLIDPEENLRDVLSINYINEEYASQLENRVVNKYYDMYEELQAAELTKNDYQLLQQTYDTVYDAQTRSNDDATSFSSAMDNMSDSSFVLYSPETEEGEGVYGYVYNILLPFSTIQNAKLTSFKADFTDEDTGAYNERYYNARNSLLKQIRTTDQRDAWFNGKTDYSFKAEEAGLTAGTDYYAGVNNDREWLFFENNLTKTTRYQAIDKYIGHYAYNGSVYEYEKGGYALIPNELSIDGMLAEFEAYINYVLDGGKVNFLEGYVAGSENTDYYKPFNDTDKSLYTEETKDKKAEDKEIDYSKFIYAKGGVDLGVSETEYRQNLLNKDSIQYKALAAVNELQYAYTTDTAVLSQYLGYSVTLGDTTGYIKEFETAAHEALARGAGSFNVCAGDYGWHLIYVAYTFGNYDAEKNCSVGGAEYKPNWENITVEGTFEYLFYEWVKADDVLAGSTTRRSQIINQFNKDNTVTKYQSRYQDLLDL